MRPQNQALIQYTSFIQEKEYDLTLVRKMEMYCQKYNQEQGAEYIITYVAQLDPSHHHIAFRSSILVLELIEAWLPLIEVASSYLQKHPQDDIVIYLLARALASQNAIEEAIILLQRALELIHPNHERHTHYQDTIRSYQQNIENHATINLNHHTAIALNDEPTNIESQVNEDSVVLDQVTEFLPHDPNVIMNRHTDTIIPGSQIFDQTEHDLNLEQLKSFQSIIGDHFQDQNIDSALESQFLESLASTNVMQNHSQLSHTMADGEQENPEYESQSSLQALDQALNQLDFSDDPTDHEDLDSPSSMLSINLDTLLDIDISLIQKNIPDDLLKSDKEAPVHIAQAYEDLKTDDQIEFSLHEDSLNIPPIQKQSLQNAVMSKLTDSSMDISALDFSQLESKEVMLVESQMVLNEELSDHKTQFESKQNLQAMLSNHQEQDSHTEYQPDSKKLAEAFALLEISDITNNYPTIQRKKGKEDVQSEHIESDVPILLESQFVERELTDSEDKSDISSQPLREATPTKLASEQQDSMNPLNDDGAVQNYDLSMNDDSLYHLLNQTDDSLLQASLYPSQIDSLPKDYENSYEPPQLSKPPQAPSIPPQAPSVPPPPFSLPKAPSVPPPPFSLPKAPVVHPVAAVPISHPSPSVSNSSQPLPKTPKIQGHQAVNLPHNNVLEIPRPTFNDYPSDSSVQAIRFRQAEESQAYIADVAPRLQSTLTKNQSIDELSQVIEQPIRYKLGMLPIIFLLISLLITLSIFFHFQRQHHVFYQQVDIVHLDPDQYQKLSLEIQSDLNNPLAQILSLVGYKYLPSNLRKTHIQQLTLKAWVETVRWTIWGEVERQYYATQALERIQDIPNHNSSLYQVTQTLVQWYTNPTSDLFSKVQKITEPLWYNFFVQGWILHQNNQNKLAIQSFLKSDNLNPYSLFNAQLIILLNAKVYGIEIAHSKSLELGKRSYLKDKKRLSFPLSYHESVIPYQLSKLKTWLIPLVQQAKAYSPLEKDWLVQTILPYLKSVEHQFLAQQIVNELLNTSSTQSLYTKFIYHSMNQNQEQLKQIESLIKKATQQQMISKREYCIIESELALQRGYLKTSLNWINHYLAPHISEKKPINDHVNHQENPFILQLPYQLKVLKAFNLSALKEWSSLGTLLTDFKTAGTENDVLSSLQTILEHQLDLSAKLSEQKWKFILQKTTSWLSHPLAHPLPFYISYLFKEGYYTSATQLLHYYLKQIKDSPYEKLNAHLQACLSWRYSPYQDFHSKQCYKVLEIQPQHALALQTLAHLSEDSSEPNKALQFLTKIPQQELTFNSERLLIRLSFQSNQPTSSPQYSVQGKKYYDLLLAQSQLRTYITHQEIQDLIQSPTPHELYLSGIQKQNHQNPEQALATLKLAASKGSRAAWQELFSHLLVQKNFEQSKLLLTSLEKEHVNDFDFMQIIELMKTLQCFAQNKRLDLHHNYKNALKNKKLKLRPPPSKCRIQYTQSLDKFQLNQSNMSTLMLLSYLYLSVGEGQKVVEAYENLLQRQPFWWHVRYALGLLHVRMKQNQSADKVLQPFMNTAQSLYASKFVRELINSIQ